MNEINTAIAELNTAKEQANAAIAELNTANTQAQASIAELNTAKTQILSELQGKLAVSRVTQSASVTESGWAVDARELNANIANTLASRIKSITKIEDISSKCQKSNNVNVITAWKFSEFNFCFGYIYAGAFGDDKSVSISIPFNPNLPMNKTVGVCIFTKYTGYDYIKCYSGNITIEESSLIARDVGGIPDFTVAHGVFAFAY